VGIRRAKSGTWKKQRKPGRGSDQLPASDPGKPADKPERETDPERRPVATTRRIEKLRIGQTL
jgi:hypothetical protein